MKVKTMLIMALMAVPVLAAAQNALTVAEMTIPKSGGDLKFNFQFAQESVYTSYQFKIETPEGAIYDTNESGDVECTLGECHTNSHSATAHWNASNSTLGVGVASMSSALLKGISGELISIPMLETEKSVGTELAFKVVDITYIRLDGTKDKLNDYEFTITIGEPDDWRIKFDENSSKLPTYTAGEKGNVRVSRTIKAGQWSTLVLPFNLTRANATAVFGSDVEFAMFEGFEVDYGEDEENLTPLGITINFARYTIPARGNLAGGTPVLVKTSQDITEPFLFDNVTLTSGVTDISKQDEYQTNGKFTGTLVKTVVPEDGLFINNNNFYYSTGKTNIKAFRGWFELDAVLDKETDFGAKMFIDGFETSVDGVSIRDAKGIIYDLSGRKVTKPQQSGIYIVNGKKAIIK